MKKSIKKIITIISLFVYCTTALGQSIVVHTGNYQQTIDMIGGDMERSSKAIQNARNKQEIIEWSFKDINFNVCRVQYDKNQELVEGTKNWAFYDKQVATMQAIKQVNPDIRFFATMRSDYDGYGDDNNLPDWIINYNTKVMQREKYAIFLADYCEYMSQQGVPISIISTAKEWMWHVRAEKARDIINKLYAELDARGIDKPIISDQGFWSISQGITYLNHVESLGTKDLYHSFCSHNYDNEPSEKWVELIEKSKALGKPMYDDETSTGSGSPTYGEERGMFKQIGEYVKKATRYEAGLSGEIFFEIWSRGIDKETRSIYFPANGTGSRKRGYYLMKHFSNNILDSRYITSSIASMPNVHTISFRKDNQVVLWVINKSTSGYIRFPIGVDAFNIDGPVQLHYWTDNTPITGLSASHQAIGNMFETSIGSEAINCYIFNVKDNPDNLALNGADSQSSTENNGTASRAIDDNTDGAWDNGSVTLTSSEENPWWQVNLGTNDTIGTINLFNRTDICCKAELSDFTVSVIDSNNATTFTQTYTSAPDSSLSIDAGGVVGQYVKIQLNGTGALALAEVQVLKGSIFEKFDQTIDFPALNTIMYTQEPISPGATASSGLGLTYTSSNTDVATIVDGEIILRGIGTTTITASISESTLYNAAPDVSQTLTVTKADQDINFDPLPVKKVGDASFLPEATASSGLVVEYASSNLQVATIENYRIVIVGEGVSNITASQAGNELFNPAEVAQELTVDKSDNEDQDTQVVELFPVHDSYVRGGSSAGENYGNETELLIKETSNTDYKRISFLQFDLYDIDRVEKAILRLYAKTAKMSQIVVSETSDDWKEQTITYNNAPGAGTALAVQTVDAAGKYYEWDVTNSVKNQIATDNLASFCITDNSSNKNNIGFYSTEAGDKLPQLVITKENAATDLVQTPIGTNPLFTVFPNPTSNFVNVSAENGIEDIVVTTLSGQVILQMNSIGQIQFKVQLDQFSEGMYLFQVLDAKGITSSFKVVLK